MLDGGEDECKYVVSVSSSDEHIKIWRIKQGSAVEVIISESVLKSLPKLWGKPDQKA